jgi:hypothetical protein
MKWHLTSRELRSQERSAYDVLRERKRLYFWIVTPILIPVTGAAGLLTILVIFLTVLVTTFLKI